MIRYADRHALFLVLAFFISCAQNQINPPQDNFSKGHNGYSESQLQEAATSKVPMSMVRNVKQARNGNILIASYLGVFRYDGTSFTNLTSKIISPRFSPQGNGIYRTNTLKGVEGRTYTLIVNTENQTYTAQSTMPQRVPFDSIKVEENVVFGDTEQLDTGV